MSLPQAEEPPPRKKRGALQVALAILVSGGIVAFLLRNTDMEAVAARIGAVRWLPLAGAGALGLLMPVLRGARFALLTTRRDLPLTIAAVGLQNLLLRVTPFRSGELVLPYVLQRCLGERLSRTLVMLIWVRLTEVWILLGLCTAAVSIRLTTGEDHLFLYAIGGFVLFSLVVLRFGVWLSLLMALGEPVLRATRLLRLASVARIWEALGQTRAEMGRLGGRRVLLVFIWSLVIWAVQFVNFGLILGAFGVWLDPVEVVLGVSMAQLASAVPVASVGNLGTHEAGWVFGFTRVGVSPADALVTGLAAQLSSLIFAAIAAVPCWLHLRGRASIAAVPSRQGKTT